MTSSGGPEVAVAELEEPGPWRNPVPFLWLAVAVLLTGAVAALLTGAAEPPPDGDAHARIVAAAGTATAGDFAFSTVLEFSGDSSVEDARTTMEGRYDAETGRLDAHASGYSDFEMDLIVDGRVQYLRFGSGSVFADATGGKPWGRIETRARPEPTRPTPFDGNPLERLAELGELTSPIVRVGEERVRGVETVHYRTTIDKSGREGVVQVDVWLDDDERLRRFRQSFDVGGTRFATSFELFDVGKPVSIDLPPADQVGPFEPKDLFREHQPSS